MSVVPRFWDPHKIVGVDAISLSDLRLESGKSLVYKSLSLGSENLYYLTLLLFAAILQLPSCLSITICCLYLPGSSIFPTISSFTSHINRIHYGKLSIGQRPLAEDGEDVSKQQTPRRCPSLYTTPPKVRPGQQGCRNKHHSTSKGRKQDIHTSIFCDREVCHFQICHFYQIRVRRGEQGLVHFPIRRRNGQSLRVRTQAQASHEKHCSPPQVQQAYHH
jgi:hypothetical protein